MTSGITLTSLHLLFHALVHGLASPLRALRFPFPVPNRPTAVPILLHRPQITAPLRRPGDCIAPSMPPPPQTRADRCISADLDQTNLCSSAPDEVRRSAADIPGLHPTMSPRVALVAAAPAAGGNARLSVLRVRAARTRIQASAGAAATASKANPRGAQRGPARPFLRGCPPDAAAWVEASVWTRL